MSKEIESKLEVYRDRIDAIDEQILALMKQRIVVAQSIGGIKAGMDEPAFYRPEREARALRRLRELNEKEQSERGSKEQGVLDNAALEVLFREIISITRDSEAGLSVAILGPLGTYSEAATRQHFGNSITVVPHATIDDIFRAAETRQSDFAVVPVENSTEGGVSHTLDRLVTTSLTICGEINLRVHHNLLGMGEQLSSVKRILGHSQSLAQCKRWIDQNLPNADLITTPSTADAALQACDDADSAAIASDSAAKRYALTRLATNIEDEPGNTTRFLVLSDRPTPPSGDDKTSLLLSCRNRPGALFHLLKPLLDHQVDMTKIESRPSKTGLWKYIFFVDVVGHQADEKIAPALQELKTEAGLYKNLGSYPASS